MKKIVSFFVLLCTFVAFSTTAQDKSSQRRQWMNEMKKAKVEFMIQELDITSEQKEKFVELYNAFENELHKLRHDTRALEKSVSSKKEASDLELTKVSEAMFEFKSKEGEITNRYYDKFKQILTPRQLFEFQKAEAKWMKQLMKHRKK